MKKYPLARFRNLLVEADYIYSMVRLNEQMTARFDISKEDLLKGLDEMEVNCFFYASFFTDEDGNKWIEITRQG